MVSPDLRKLSAQLEAMRSDVDGAYKALDKKWQAVTDELKTLPIPCSVSFVIDRDPQDQEFYTTLEWRKWKGGKRICYVTHYLEMTPIGPEAAEDITPYEEWGAELRLDMLKHVPALFEAAVRQTKAFIARAHEEGARQ